MRLHVRVSLRPGSHIYPKTTHASPSRVVVMSKDVQNGGSSRSPSLDRAEQRDVHRPGIRFYDRSKCCVALSARVQHHSHSRHQGWRHFSYEKAAMTRGAAPPPPKYTGTRCLTRLGSNLNSAWILPCSCASFHTNLERLFDQEYSLLFIICLEVIKFKPCPPTFTRHCLSISVQHTTSQRHTKSSSHSQERRLQSTSI